MAPEKDFDVSLAEDPTVGALRHIQHELRAPPVNPDKATFVMTVPPLRVALDIVSAAETRRIVEAIPQRLNDRIFCSMKPRSAFFSWIKAVSNRAVDQYLRLFTVLELSIKTLILSSPHSPDDTSRRGSMPGVRV